MNKKHTEPIGEENKKVLNDIEMDPECMKVIGQVNKEDYKDISKRCLKNLQEISIDPLRSNGAFFQANKKLKSLLEQV